MAGMTRGSGAVPPMMGRADQAITSVTIPASTPTGKYYIIAQADALRERIQQTQQQINVLMNRINLLQQ